MLKVDYVDILQLHNPRTLPDPNDVDGPYAGLLEAKERGLVRYIGITNHRLTLAWKRYDRVCTIPFSIR